MSRFGCERGLRAELHDQVERAQLLDLATVFVAIRLFDEPAELRVQSAGHVARDPIAHAHRIDAARRRRCVRVGRVRIALAELLLQDRIDLGEVAIGVGHGVVPAVEVARVAGVRGPSRVRVEQAKAEAPCEAADMGVRRVHHRAAPFRVLTLAPVAALRVHPSTDARGRLVDHRLDARVFADAAPSRGRRCPRRPPPRARARVRPSRRTPRTAAAPPRPAPRSRHRG